MVLGLLLEEVVSLVFTIGLKTDLVALLGPYFGKIIKGLRDRYIGSLFRVDEPVPDDSCIDLKKAGALNSAYLESIIIQ